MNIIIALPPSLPPSLHLLPSLPLFLPPSLPSLPPSLPSLPPSIPFETIRFYYPQWSERENWLIFKANLSPKSRRPRPPKLVCMHMMSIPTCRNFLSRFRSIKFFHDHAMDYSPCPEREIWPFLIGSHISETGETTPTKTGVHARDIDPCLYEFI